MRLATITISGYKVQSVCLLFPRIKALWIAAGDEGQTGGQHVSQIDAQSRRAGHSRVTRLQ